MIIKSLILKNYRNYSKLNIELDNKLNIFIGKNAQGKTNILESIYVLGLTKSFLTNNDKNLIKNGQNVCNIKANTLINSNEKKLNIVISENNKIIKINNKKIVKYSDYVSKFNIVIFSPYDLKLIKDSPIVRRKYLNIEISQLSNNYLIKLSEFNYILRVRNELLKMMKQKKYNNKTYFNIITDKFIELSVFLFSERKKFIDNINNYLSKIYGNISGFSYLNIKYVSNVEYDDDYDEMKQKLKLKLEKNYEKEIFNGMSLYGIHRDDFKFLLNDIDLSIYGSQGQQRLAVLALKLSELEIFKLIKNEYPVLLLDDLFSELDSTKKNNILKYLDYDIQTIITTTDINKISKKYINKAKVFKVYNGEVEEEKNEKRN